MVNSSPETGQVVRSPTVASPGGRSAVAATAAVAGAGGGAWQPPGKARGMTHERGRSVVRMTRGLAGGVEVVDLIRGSGDAPEAPVSGSAPRVPSYSIRGCATNVDFSLPLVSLVSLPSP